MNCNVHLPETPTALPCGCVCLQVKPFLCRPEFRWHRPANIVFLGNAGLYKSTMWKVTAQMEEIVEEHLSGEHVTFSFQSV